MTQYIKRGWYEKAQFTENGRGGWYKKAPLIQYVSWGFYLTYKLMLDLHLTYKSLAQKPQFIENARQDWYKMIFFYSIC